MRNLVRTSFLAGLVVFLLVARVFALRQSPPGFFVDESSIGYNAWTILKSGNDEHGISYPLYFKAFGDYKNPIFVYSVSVLMFLFGPSIETVRLTSALWGIGAIAIFTYLVWAAKVRGPSLWIVLLLVLTNPWFFQLSRVAFEVASTPFFLFAAVLAYYKLSNTERISNRTAGIWLCTFALSLAGTFYSYTSGRILAPLLLLVGLILLMKKISLWQLFLTGALCLLCVLPALFWEIANPGVLLARYQVVGLSHYTQSAAEFVAQASTNYRLHFSPRFLFFGGDGNLRHAPAPFGVLLLSSIPFALVGLFSLIAEKRGSFAYWVLFGILISPLPSALTIQSPHVLRSVGLLVFVCILFWHGAEYLHAHVQARFIMYAWTITLVLETLLFLPAYFTSYSQNAGIWFDSTTVDLIETSVNYPGPYFLSSKLYPGTDATVDFLRITHDPSQSIPFEKTIVFNPETGFPNTRGVFLIDSDTCTTLPQSFLNTATHVKTIGGNCAYLRNL